MRRRSLCILNLGLFALCLTSFVHAQGGVGGKWEGHITNERGEHIITIAQFVQDGSKVTGDLSMYGSEPMPICSGAFDGQILRFEIDRNWIGGQTCADLDPKSVIRFEGRVNGPSLSGIADDGKIKGSLFWIHIEEPLSPTPIAVAPTPAVVAPTPVPVAPTPAPGATPAASGQFGGSNPYEVARAYIAAVRGKNADAFVAVWKTTDRNQAGPQLRELFQKAYGQFGQIADALEAKLAADAFRLQDGKALLSYPCTGKGAGQQCIFTVIQESDGRWYVEDLD